MNIYNRATVNSSQQTQVETARFMTRVYAWMSTGILLTGAVSYYVASSRELMMSLMQNHFLFYVLIGLELGAVVFLMAMINKISSVTATFLYLAYAALTGVTLSVIFLIYTKESITQVFALTSFAFGGLSAFGLITKRDLGPLGAFCSMGLWGLIGYGLISMFFPAWIDTPFDKAMSSIGVLVFAGLTAYDTQKIKALSRRGGEGSDEDRKGAIVGAMILYLDFINLFLQLLKLMGKKRD